MPELRVTITEKMDDLLDRIVETGLFSSKADLLRYAMIAYLKDLGWLEKPTASHRQQESSS